MRLVLSLSPIKYPLAHKVTLAEHRDLRSRTAVCAARRRARRPGRHDRDQACDRRRSGGQQRHACPPPSGPACASCRASRRGPCVRSAGTAPRRSSTRAQSPANEFAADEQLVVETADSLCGLTKREPAGFVTGEALELLCGACPVTGPIHMTCAIRALAGLAGACRYRPGSQR